MGEAKQFSELSDDEKKLLYGKRLDESVLKYDTYLYWYSRNE